MDEMKYLYELFELMPRCGPGAAESTRRAFSLCTALPEKPYILDIGCGNGTPTIELARLTKGKIIALDNHQPFLNILAKQAQAAGVNDHISTKCQSMLEMDFQDNTFDLIWSEGALYFMGFAEGLRKCYQLLKRSGYAAVSEAVYLKPDIPAPVKKLWEGEYSTISSIDNKLVDVKKAGFQLLSHFTLPKSAWLNNFYYPMEKILAPLKEKYKDNKTALDFFQTNDFEIDVYKKYSDYYGYEFFIMQKK